MPRKLIKRFMPDHEVIKRQKALKIFGNVLYNPNLWCLNRRSASGAFAVGLFMAFVPLPSQMIMSAGLAIVCGVNLPLSVALVWVSNPITMPVLFYFAYKVGALVMHTPPQPFHFRVIVGLYHAADEHHWSSLHTRLYDLWYCLSHCWVLRYQGTLALFCCRRSWQQRKLD